MKTLKLVVIGALLVSCACKKNKTPSESVDQNQNSKVFLKTLLPQSTYSTIENTSSVKLFTIEKKRLEGTTDEYSNKSKFVRTLNTDEQAAFISTILEDGSYKWELYKEQPEAFEPSKQFVVTGATSQANVLYDEAHSLISVIDLDGQHILPISKAVQDFLNNL